MKKPIVIDKNFALNSAISRDGMIFLNAQNSDCFRLSGLMWDEDGYYRLPKSVVDKTDNPQTMSTLARFASGGKISFITDSPYVAIKAVLPSITTWTRNMPLTSSAGFDIYVDGTFLTSFPPDTNASNYCVEGIKDFVGQKERRITLNFPLYNPVKELYIGLKEGSSIKPLCESEYTKPVVFYGSSITQGGSASRPGMCYEAILSRKLNFEYVNLGFAGNAKGESAIAEYISSLEMSAFVFDYDHNAPTPEHLEKTHKPFFDVIREKHPDLPIICISRPAYCLSEDGVRRRDIIKATVDSAIEAGDKNVYFIDGSLFMQEIADDGTVDGCHPTDLGFYAMANGILPVLTEALKNTRGNAND